MTISRQEMIELIEDLPDKMDIEEIMYRLYLRRKIEAAEQDAREGNIIAHGDLVKETSTCFQT